MRPKLEKGFSLVEMAVVLVIMGLLLSAVLVPLSTQFDLRNYSDNNKAMNDIKDALVGFGMRNGYLPCPAVSYANGNEDRTLGVCNKRSGFIPWVTLGLPKLDSWGHLYGYSVTPAYSIASPTIGLSTATDILVRTRDTNGVLVDLSPTPAVIISFGRDGTFGYANDGVQVANKSATNADEQMNGAATTIFISRDRALSSGAPGGEFDDAVTWISPYQYIEKQVSVGNLP